MRGQRDPSAIGLLKGLLDLLRGRADGFAAFSQTPTAFIFSLLPLMSLLPFEAAISATSGADSTHQAMSAVLAGFCMLLIPPVVSHAVAQRLRREPVWLRYAVAYNWCHWATCIIAAIAVVFAAQLAGAGAADRAAAITIGVFGIYDLWLQWFLAKRGLLLSGKAAALTVALTNAASLAIAVIAYQYGNG